ncbi:MAG: hypothetical protein AAF996_03270 [Pseudomonadota bacterium]
MKGLLMLVGSMLITLASCTTSPNHSTALPCTTASVSVTCFLQSGQATLNATEDPFAWSSGAIELAIAFDTADQSQSAFDLYQQALSRSTQIEDSDRRGAVLVEAMVGLADFKPTDEALNLANEIIRIADLSDAGRQDDLLAKHVVVKAVHGNKAEALQAGLDLPQTNAREENYKAVSLRKLANQFAKDGDFERSAIALEAITMSISYYQAMARSDVARAAYAADRDELAEALLGAADSIARAQDSGYFIAAALRDIGYSYHLAGVSDLADAYFDEAVTVARTAEKQNEMARATSRIATRKADAGLQQDAIAILIAADTLASKIESPQTKGYSYYEIVGSAAFAGRFQIARSWLANVPDMPLGSSSSMLSAAKRDLAWGLARNGDLVDARLECDAIPHAREKAQCFARVVRVILQPNMTALPRYL